MGFLRIFLISTVLTAGFNLVAPSTLFKAMPGKHGTNTFYLMDAEPMDLSLDETVALQSQDGHEFKIPVHVAQQSQTLRDLIQDAGIETPIPLPNIDSETLAHVISILYRLDELSPEELTELRNFTLTEKKALNTKDKIFQALFYLDIPLVTVLTSSDDQKILAPVRVVRQIPLLKEMIKSGMADIALTNIDGATLKRVIDLLTKLDPFIMHNARVAPQNQTYIPRAYQPLVNKELEKLSLQEIALLHNAADFLDNPFIVNAVAAVIADRIYNDVRLIADSYKSDNWGRWTGWYYLNTKQRNEILMMILEKQHVAIHNADYVLKHLTLRLNANAVTQEYSIADYLKDHPQQEFIEGARVQLSSEKLTSLFGIELLPNSAQMSGIHLHNNPFYSLALDPQAPAMPFARFKDLRALFLQHTSLIELPASLFEGLDALTFIQLGHNRLTHLPMALFSYAPSVAIIDLADNRLIELPDAIFKNNSHLEDINLDQNNLFHVSPLLLESIKQVKKLSIQKNFLNGAELQRIKAYLPNTKVESLDQRDHEKQK